VDSWSDHYREELLVKASPRSTVGFDMRGNGEKITRANESLVQTVIDRKIFHNGDPLLRRHALNAKRFANRWGITFRKDSRESPNKVDGYAATLLAFIALNELAERGRKAPVQYDSSLYQF
jgi:phage terminase large subunit-like protein